MNAYGIIRANASTCSTRTLVDVLQVLDTTSAEYLAGRNYAAVRQQNMVTSAVIDVLTDRLPALDAAIDAWCDDLDAPEQTMASFVIEFMQGVTA